VVHEILDEINAQPYDLVVMGAASPSAKLRHLFLPNVTAEIAEAIQVPVLVARSGQDWIF
jgi:nucleotide-binding universal stress UspA family protein